MPFVAQVAVGRFPHVNVFGNDYHTPDGTGKKLKKRVFILKFDSNYKFFKVFVIIFILVI